MTAKVPSVKTRVASLCFLFFAPPHCCNIAPLGTLVDELSSPFPPSGAGHTTDNRWSPILRAGKIQTTATSGKPLHGRPSRCSVSFSRSPLTIVDRIVPNMNKVLIKVGCALGSLTPFLSGDLSSTRRYSFYPLPEEPPRLL